MEENQNPNTNLELAIKNPDLKLLTKQYTELLIDGVLKDGTLKDLPIVNSIIGLINFGSSINRNIATKKIYKFLFQLNEVPEEKRKKKIEQINSSEKYQTKVGEIIFEILDKIESDGKPEIIGKLFCAVIEEKIDYLTFLKISHIIKSIFYYDLVFLKENYDGKYITKFSDDSLLVSGIVQNNADFVKAFETGLNSDEKYEQEKNTLTEIGKIIIEIGMN